MGYASQVYLVIELKLIKCAEVVNLNLVARFVTYLCVEFKENLVFFAYKTRKFQEVW